MSSAARSPAKSPVRHSTFAPGTFLWIIRTVPAKIAAPPSARSSRSTAVSTRYLPPRAPPPFGAPLGLEPIDLALRRAGLDVAEVAAPRAGVAEDHDRRRAGAPALADVRAHRLLADGVEVEAAHLVPHVLVRLAGRQANLEPLGLPLRRLGRDQIDGGHGAPGSFVIPAPAPRGGQFGAAQA